MAIRNVTNGSPAAADEDKLDQMLDDSFPASDPPSFTPVARMGKPPENEIDDFPGDDCRSNLALKIALGAVAAGTAIFFIVQALRGRGRKKSRRFAAADVQESASALLQPILDAAQTGKDAVASVRKEAMRRAA